MNPAPLAAILNSESRGKPHTLRLWLSGAAAALKGFRLPSEVLDPLQAELQCFFTLILYPIYESCDFDMSFATATVCRLSHLIPGYLGFERSTYDGFQLREVK